MIKTAKIAETFIKELEDIGTSVVSNDSPIVGSNVKSLQDLKSESPNKKLSKEKLQQVRLQFFFKSFIFFFHSTNMIFF